MKKLKTKFFAATIISAIQVLSMINGESVKGQSSKGVHIGPLFSVNSVWIINQNTYGKTELEYAPAFGLGYGLALGYNFVDRVGIQTELRVHRQGQKYEDVISYKDTSYNINRHVKTNYIHVPVFFKLTGGKSDTRFYTLIGPEFGFLQSAFIYEKVGDEENNINAKESFQKTDIGLGLGLGADIWIADNIYLNTGMQFYYGLSDINASSYRKTYDTTLDGAVNEKDKAYEKSQNAFGGFTLGFHYLFNQ